MVDLLKVARREVKHRHLHVAFKILRNEYNMDWQKAKALCFKWRRLDG